ncbi:MAG: RsmD family RNA methyltransferase [Candidatus Magasanikbacteria bacterium]|nr:RsmD family RNA methyltransferase [Candidatus Magasanikbacteria bacterium]
MKYIFNLGHQPKISFEEIVAILERDRISHEIYFENEKFLILELDKEIDSEKMLMKLGGTIKIGKEIEKIESVENTAIEYLNRTQPEGKIQFSINGDDKKNIALSVKKGLKKEGRSVRFVETNTSASVVYNKLMQKNSDLMVSKGLLFVTTAIQDFEGFSKRDMNRPAIDKKSGTLPPKLSKIMINLAKGSPTKNVLLDPFCGSGTILNEAIVLGYHKLVANDSSKQAIEDTKKNVKWIGRELDKHPNVRFTTARAEQIEKTLTEESVNIIVTEPFMGKPLLGRETEKELQNQANGLSDMYLASFRSFHKILAANATVVFIFPQFRFEGDWIKTERIEEIKKLGYKVMPFSKNESLLYYRKGQFVARNIWRFRKV